MTSSDHRATPRRSWSLAATVLLGSAVSGCGYGPVSPTAYEHAKSIYTLANMKAESAIDATQVAIDEDAAAGDINEQEAGWLRAMCEDCRASRWKDAAQDARSLMQAQVRP